MTSQYDLLIIGGGIYGLALARESARAGYRVLLAERGDYAAATSANSLRVIHGGIRYLQDLDIPRTLYSARERSWMLRYAPELVRPLPCLVGLRRGVVTNELTVGGVAALYNVLTRRRNRDVPLENRISSAGLVTAQTLQANVQVPLREPGDFGLFWNDAQASDTDRLAVRFLMDALRAGADCRNHTAVVGMNHTEECWQVTLRPRDAVASAVDQQTDKVSVGEKGEAEVPVRARWVVDCSGAACVAEHLLWHQVDQASRAARQPLSTHKGPQSYIQAINLVSRKSLGQNAFGFNSSVLGRSRMLFATPCQGHTLIGTWYFDRPAADPMQRPGADSLSQELVQSCVDEVNSAFRQPVLTMEDVSQVQSGWLPACDEPSALREPGENLLRHNRIDRVPGQPDLWILRGTKYTTARYTAERFVRQTLPKPRKQRKSVRRESSPVNAQSDRLAWMLQQIADEQLVHALRVRYGHYLADFLEYVKAAATEFELLAGHRDRLAAEVLYAVEHEGAVTLADIVIRRLGVGALAVPAEETIDHCLALLESYAGWTQSRCAAERTHLLSSYPAWLRSSAGHSASSSTPADITTPTPTSAPTPTSVSASASASAGADAAHLKDEPSARGLARDGY